MKLFPAITLPVFALFACSTQPSAAPASELDALMEAHDSAWNAHDPEALADLFIEHGTLVTPMGTRVEGRKGLLELFASPGPTKQTSSTSAVDAVQWLSDDLVVVDATQTLTGPGVAALPTDQAKLVAVAQRVDDTWRFVAARPFIPLKK